MTFKEYLIKVIQLQSLDYTETELDGMTTAELQDLAEALEKERKN